MDETGRKYWEIAKTKAAMRELRSINRTIDGKEIAIEYTAIPISKMVVPYYLAQIRKRDKIKVASQSG